MEIKTLPVLPVHSLARTVDKASPDIQPIQLVARTVTESTNHIAMSTVQAGNQTAINVVAMVFGPCFWQSINCALQVANKAVTQKRNPGTTMAQKSKATLVVSDLSAGTSSHQLRVLFSEVGTIKVWWTYNQFVASCLYFDSVHVTLLCLPTVWLSFICLPGLLSVCVYAYFPFVRTPVYLYVSVSVPLFVVSLSLLLCLGLPVCLYVSQYHHHEFWLVPNCDSVCILSVCADKTDLFIWLSVCLVSVCVSVSLSVFCLTGCVSVSFSVLCNLTAGTN